jgi:hypothetical protein
VDAPKKFCEWITYPRDTRWNRFRTRLAKWIAPWLREPPKISGPLHKACEDRLHIGGGH